MKIKEKFITDEKGKKVSVIISIKEYKELIEKVEEFEEIKLFDKLKSEDEELIPFDKAIEEIEKSRKK